MARLALMVTVAVLPAFVAAGGGSPAPAEDATLRVTVAVECDRAALEVGTPATVHVVLHNLTDRPLVVPDWTRHPAVLRVGLQLSLETGAAAEVPGGAPALPAARTKADFRPLPPGHTEFAMPVTPMLAGYGMAWAVFAAPTADYVDADGTRVRFADAWTGRAFGRTPVTVASDMTEAMALTYAQHMATVVDAAAEAEAREAALESASRARHVFAARFVRDAYLALEPGPLKWAALDRLLALATFGTAYEAVPVLAAAMTSRDVPAGRRMAILEWLAKLLAAEGRQLLAGQVPHRYAEPLLAQMRDAVRRLATDPDAALATGARAVIESWTRPAPGGPNAAPLAPAEAVSNRGGNS